MLLWLLLICLAIIVLVAMWYITPVEIDNVLPTMHVTCEDNISCGGDLVCDVKCKTCKQKLYGNCATDVDCETGLYCHNWKCVDIIMDLPIEEQSYKSPKKDGYHVSWLE